MEKKMTKEQMLKIIADFADLMEYIYNERMYWYEQRGNMDKALSDIHHAIENDYDAKDSNKYAKLMYEVTKERRKYKDMQELFLPVYNAYKSHPTLSSAIWNMRKYDGMIKEGRTYEPKILHELFEKGGH